MTADLDLKRLAAVIVLCVASCAPAARQRLPAIAPGEPSFFPTVAAHTDARFVDGNRVEILLNGDETFPALLRAIAGARRSVTFEQYFYEGGQLAADVAHALADRCRHGVAAHVLLDSFGASAIPGELVSEMKAAGCEVEWFRRIKVVQFLTPWELLSYNNRSHRRIVVVDGGVGFTGGYGISEAWTGDGLQSGHWRDTNVRVAGPVVQQLQAAFVRDWRATTRTVLGGDAYFPVLARAGDVTAQMVTSAPGGGSSESYMLFLLAIATAQRSIAITNPYFVLDDEMRDALVAAAARGVRIDVIVPGQLETVFRVDQNLVYYAGRGDFGPLLRAGIRIHQYEPALLHAKTMVVDGRWAMIGSTNFDRRSFALNEEINLTAFDPGIAGRLERIFEDDLRRSHELTYREWQSRGLIERFFELFAIPAKRQL